MLFVEPLECFALDILPDLGLKSFASGLWVEFCVLFGRGEHFVHLTLAANVSRFSCLLWRFFFCTIWCQLLWFCANVSCVHCFVEYQNSVPTCRNKCTGAQLTLWLFISGILHTILGEQSRVKILQSNWTKWCFSWWVSSCPLITLTSEIW